MYYQLLRPRVLQTVCVLFSVAACGLQSHPAWALACGAGAISDSAPGWLWDGMSACDSSGPPSVSAHAGPAGASGTYVFTGTGVTIYGIADSTVKVGNVVHRVNHIRITVDGVTEGEVSDSVQGTVASPVIFTVHNLPNQNHSLVLEAVNGWAAVNSITVETGSPTVDQPTSSDADAPAVPNGDFESPRFNTYTYLPTGGAWIFGGGTGGVISDNSFTGGSGIAVPNSDFTRDSSGDATQVAFLQGGRNSYIAQRIYFPKAGKYVVTFQSAQRGSGSSSHLTSVDHEDFCLLINNFVLGTFYPTSAAFKTYTSKPFDVDTPKTVVVGFVGIDTAGDDETVLLDNVSIQTYHK
jgi:hypothetical protein